MIVGMDYTAPNLDLVQSGEVWGLVGQPLVEEYYLATKLAIAAAQGIPVPEQNWLPAPFVTLDNIDQFQAYAEAIE